MAKHSQSTEKSILDRIKGHVRGWVFTSRYFLDLASRPAITSALRRQTEPGTIRQLGRGLYDFPKLHPALGQLAPTPEALAKAMAGRDRVRLQPSGAYAANLLGLSEQAPAKVVFLTDGPSRLVRVGPMTLQLRRTTPRNMAAAGRPAGLVIQAFRHLGSERITQDRIARPRQSPSADDRLSRWRPNGRIVRRRTWPHDACVPRAVSCRTQGLHRRSRSPSGTRPSHPAEGLLGVLADEHPVQVVISRRHRLQRWTGGAFPARWRRGADNDLPPPG